MRHLLGVAIVMSSVGALGCAAPRAIEANAHSKYLQPQDVSSLVRRENPALRRCYVEHIDTSRPEERIRVRWTIDTAGKTSVVRVEETTFQARDVEQCLVARIMTWSFPPPDRPTDVVFPFVFRPVAK